MVTGGAYQPESGSFNRNAHLLFLAEFSANVEMTDPKVSKLFQKENH